MVNGGRLRLCTAEYHKLHCHPSMPIYNISASLLASSSTKQVHADKVPCVGHDQGISLTPAKALTCGAVQHCIVVLQQLASSNCVDLSKLTATVCLGCQLCILLASKLICSLQKLYLR